MLDGDRRAWAFLALAAAYGLTGIAVLRTRRDFASALGIAALALAFPASVWLLDGTWLVLAWAATGAVLALLARYEQRLEVGAFAYLCFALVHTLLMEAQPNDVFIAHDHPGSGLRLCCSWSRASPCSRTPASGCARRCVGRTVRSAFTPRRSRSSRCPSARRAAARYRVPARPHCRECRLGPSSGSHCYPRAQASRALQVGGFALFGISLAKLFLYDLAFLSSITRAFSFLAVGAMLIMVGGFFYQRLAQESQART